MRAAIASWVGRVPQDVQVVGLVALLLGIAWSMLTPVFQVPDEPAHYSYVQYLAETGRLPEGSTSRPVHSSEQEALMGALGTYAIIGRNTRQVEAADAGSRRALVDAGRLPRDDGGGSTTSTTQPPLYYGLAAIVYRTTGFLGPVARVRAVRLFSVALFAVGAMLAAVLAGTLFPSVPWARATGGMAVAVAPVPGFIAGGVTPDNLLNTLVTGLCLAMVVGLRNPSIRHAGVIGLVSGLALITKLTFAGLLPAAAVAILIIAWRVGREAGARTGVAVLAVGAVAASLPVLMFAVGTALQGRPLIAPGSSTPALPAEQIAPASLRENFSYGWQLFLPRMPWQNDLFGFSPIRDTWIAGWVGRYGWLDYGVSAWMRDIGTWCVWLLGALAVSGLAQHARAVWASRAELLCFALLAMGLGVAIALIGYDYKRTTGYVFEQVRYLFPLLGLYGAVITAATVGLGRTRGPTLAVAITALLVLHGVSGIVLTVARYYAN